MSSLRSKQSGRHTKNNRYPLYSMATVGLEQALSILSIEVQKISKEIIDRDRVITELQLIIETQQLLCNPLNKWMKYVTPPGLQRSADAVGCLVRHGGEPSHSIDLVILRQAHKKTLYWFNVETGTEIYPQVECRYLRSSIVFHNDEVVTVGGAISKETTAQRSDELLSYNMSTCQWEQKLPCMPTKRSRTTALITNPLGTGGPLIIIIGGEDERGNTLKTVEILDTTNNTWRRAQDIPEERCCSSGAIAHNHVYMLGGWRGIDMPTSAVFRCLLSDLLQSQYQSQQQAEYNGIWKKLPDLPVEEAVCAAFQDTLLVIGGRANTVAVPDIRVYNPNQNRWDVIDYIKQPRYICFAVGFQDKLVILGGKKTSESTEDTMEIFQVNRTST